MQIHQRKKKEIRHITDDPEIYSDDSNEGQIKTKYRNIFLW